MHPLEHGPQRRATRVPVSLGATAAGLALGLAPILAAGLSGCASPAPPRPPSLRLPAVVRALAAERTGDTVSLRFSVPQRTTDNLPVRERSLGLRVCRELEHGPCDPVAGLPATVAVPSGVTPPTVVLSDTLRGHFAQGPPRLMGYRVEFFNSAGRTAGYSDPAWVAAGAAPAPVTGFGVTGSRLGVLLSWQPAPTDGGHILFEREAVRQGGAPASSAVAEQPMAEAPVLLRPDPAAPPGNRWMLDTGAAEQVPYRYTAFREREVRLEDHALTQRSERTPSLEFTLRDVFPPPAPTDLTAAPFFGAAAEAPSPAGTPAPVPGAAPSPPAPPDSAYAVDLIWQPVEDAGLAGYNIYREPLDVSGQPSGARVRLNASPVPLPGFHDTTATPGAHYRWSVTAVDRKGNESAPASTEVNPAATLPPPLPVVPPRRHPHNR